ncbi:hypothetical protein O203_23930 [Ectopseudomonas chengduensis]|nr:hypothetical protein [Pseudomonas chengduensis]ERH51201.1 hypothetical protein O203_23930 [Pseudomonas chengduensis]
MGTTWKLTSLEKWIEANRPNDKHAAELPKSLSRSSFILDYHLVQARDAFAEFQPAGGDGFEMFAAMASFAPKFARAALIHEANVIAAIHTVRNYADIFAQLANTLAMPKPLEIRDCDFGKVADKLPVSDLKTKMQELNSSHWFRYLAAFSNTAKHRRLLQSQPTTTFTDNVSGLRVEEFSYQFRKHEPETTFPCCWGHDLLEEAYTVYRRILQLGQTLNDHVIQ